MAGQFTIRDAHTGELCEDFSALHAGDECVLSGEIFTIRDATVKLLVDELRENGRLPYGLEGALLFHAGPTPPRAGRPVGSIGPTTAKRMDAASVELMDAGIAAYFGKASRSDDFTQACGRNGAVYFGAVGGVAALYAQHVTSAQTVAYDELGTEALIRLSVEDMPVFVATDTQGVDWYKEAPRRFLALQTVQDGRDG